MERVRVVLENFLRRRPNPDEVVALGILDDSPVSAGLFFGQPLANAPKVDGVPVVVFETCTWMRENNALAEEGIFRVPGTAEDIKRIKATYDAAGSLDLTPFDAHSVAGVLKLYLRELPDPLFQFDRYDRYLAAARQHQYDNDQLVAALKEIVADMPEENQALAAFLLQFLKEASTYAATSKMTLDNCAMVFAPNVLRPKEETLTQIMQDTNFVKVILRNMIEHCDSFIV